MSRVPFADWLEEAIPALCGMDVRCIGMVAILKDGAVATNYYKADVNDLAAMGYRLMEEGMLQTLRSQGNLMRKAIEDAETRTEEDENNE